MPDRIAAHAILYGGKLHKLSVAYVDANGCVRVEPLQEETPNTVFVNGMVEVEAVDGAICVKRGNKESAL